MKDRQDRKREFKCKVLMTESNLGYTHTAPRKKGERGDLSYSNITKALKEVFELDLGPSSKSQRHRNPQKEQLGTCFM